jgi:hypothetical protein
VAAMLGRGRSDDVRWWECVGRDGNNDMIDRSIWEVD